MDDILFSQLENDIEVNTSYETLGNLLKTNFEEIYQTFYNGVNTCNGNRVALIDYISHYGKNKGDDLLERHKNFNLIFLSFLNQTKKILNLKIGGFKIDKICEFIIKQFDPTKHTFDSIKYSVLILLIAGETIRLIEDLYRYQTTAHSIDKNKCPHIYYAHKGAEQLGLRWSMYSRRIWQVIKNTLRMSAEDIADLLLKIYNKHSHGNIVDRTGLSYSEKICVAFADYSYFKSSSYAECQYINFSLLEDCPIPTYDSRAKFNFGYGLHGVIGKYSLEGDEARLFIVFSGTEIGYKSARVVANNIHTDLVQILAMADSAYFAAVGIVRELQEKHSKKKIEVIGHSLGGGLAQFSVAALANEHPYTLGICYNSAGLSKETSKLVKTLDSLIIKHVFLNNDPISKVGIQVGDVKIIKSEYSLQKAHFLKNLNFAINEKPVVACLM